MSEFQLNILGCGSATPTARHLPSAQALNFRGHLMMVDCGEGAQLQLRRMKLKFSRLEHVFISHLHGDHFLGLPGLLSTLALHEKGGRIVIHTFAQGIDILRRIMSVFCRETPFEIVYDEVDPAGGVVLDTKGLTIEAFPLAHRVPCVGYVFREKAGERHIIGDMVRYLGLTPTQIAAVRGGADFTTADGRHFANDRLTTPPTPPRSYAYCSDTAYSPAIVPYISGVDTLYHESTYLESDAAKAAARGHSTAAQAGKIATAAGVRRLVLGHYSQRYDDDALFKAEAATTYSGEIITAREGLTINL